MNILFVCKHNRFRSKVAEALFNHYNKNSNIKVKSGGTTLGLNHSISLPAKEILVKKRIVLEKEQSQRIDESLINWADKIIIVADNVPKKIFPKNKVEIWPIPDALESDIPGIKERIKKIESLVKKLIKSIS